MAGLWGINSSGQATKANSFPVTLASDEDAQDLTIGGVAPQLDDTDKIAVSLYGKDSAAGDTPILATSTGVVVVAPGGTTSFEGDGQSQSPIGIHGQSGTEHFLAVAEYNSDGAGNWRRKRCNLDVTLLASGARTATSSSADQDNFNGRGVIVTLDVTADPASASITLAIERKDSVGGKYEKLLDAVAVAAVGTHTYIVYPGCGAAADDVVETNGYPLGRIWRVTVTHADTDSITYSVSGSLVL